MPLPPKILSVWGSETGDDFLGSASLLDREHVLTVKHMFRDCWSEVPMYSRDTVYVADAERANSRRIQVVEPVLHDTLDAAIGRLAKAWTDSLASWPGFLAQQVCLNGQELVGHVVDRDLKTVVMPAYRVMKFDDTPGVGEWVLQNQTAPGYSGGLLTYKNEVVGLLHIRSEREPKAFAICTAQLRDWLEQHVPGWTALGTAQARCVEAVKEIEHLLAKQPGLDVLADLWVRDALVPRSISRALMALATAVEKALPVWERRRAGIAGYPHSVREDCCALAGRVVRLGVDVDALRRLLDDPAQVMPVDSVGLAALCQALVEDLPCQLSPHVHAENPDVMTAKTAMLSKALVAGVDKEADQDVARQFYFDVYGIAPQQIDPRLRRSLLARMRLETEENKVPYRLAGIAPSRRNDSAYTHLVDLADTFGAVPVARSGWQGARCPFLFEDEEYLVQALHKCILQIGKIQ
jgi:hypothetical protein